MTARYGKWAASLSPGFTAPLRRNDGCQFIAGDPHVVRRGEDPHCGAARQAGSPYCAEHHRIAYVPRKEPATHEMVGKITGRALQP